MVASPGDCAVKNRSFLSLLSSGWAWLGKVTRWRETANWLVLSNPTLPSPSSRARVGKRRGENIKN